jgi:glutamate-5-semialdehyde dehydrogenase
MTAVDANLASHCEQLAQQARAASRVLALVPTVKKNAWLKHAAAMLGDRRDVILEANERDLAAAREHALNAAQVDRLRLTRDRLNSCTTALRQVAELDDPVGRIIEQHRRPNGLEVAKVGVPLGVVLFIYESRPNVTVDAAGLCVKSGNAIILRGGKEALHSNLALAALLRSALKETGLPVDAVQLVYTTDRDAVGYLLKMENYIDLVIPRGGESLIRRVTEESRIPVMKHYRGNCHVYVERTADLDMAERILINAKCQRPGVCNAAESLLVDQEIAASFLPGAARALQQHGVQIRGCPTVRRIVGAALPATEEDFAAEYLDLILSIKVVENIDQAIDHIDRFGSRHTETIVTRDEGAAEKFTREVDSAAVLVNASTRFNDGSELGLGAEIGISTDKLHARGPCGLRELTSYKYIVRGDGHVRS